MALQVTITGIPGFDGDYEFDEGRPFNGHELHLIKRVSGVRLGEIKEATRAGDYDLLVAVAAILIWRAGKVGKEQVNDLVEMLLDADGGKVVYTQGNKADDNPPAEAPASELGSSGAENES